MAVSAISGSVDGWSDLLWPHRSRLDFYYVEINESRVFDYNFNLFAGFGFTVGVLEALVTIK